MENTLLTIKLVGFYILFGAELAIVGCLMITILYELIWGKVLKRRISTHTAVEEPTEGGLAMKP